MTSDQFERVAGRGKLMYSIYRRAQSSQRRNDRRVRYERLRTWSAQEVFESATPSPREDEVEFLLVCVGAKDFNDIRMAEKLQNRKVAKLGLVGRPMVVPWPEFLPY